MNRQPSAKLRHYQWSLLHAHLDWVSRRHADQESEISKSEYSPHYTADWVQKGRLRLSIGNRFKAIEARAGEWIFRRPGKVVTSIAYPGTEWASIGFSMRWTGAVKLLRPPNATIWKTGPIPELEEKLSRLCDTAKKIQGEESTYDMLYAETDMHTHFQYSNLFYDWLMTWERAMRDAGYGWYQAKESNEIILHAVQHLEERALDQNICVSTMAQSMGISPRHLSRLFNKEYGLSPKAYHMQIKLKNAIQELQTTKDEVKEIASRFGCNPVWFGVWIKRETGKTPSQIRKGL
jgi:AraC-like DNA-binding protein